MEGDRAAVKLALEQSHSNDPENDERKQPEQQHVYHIYDRIRDSKYHELELLDLIEDAQGSQGPQHPATKNKIYKVSALCKSTILRTVLLEI
jgi:hypothetical protein